jgi:uncharacterized protein YjbI with pentapeptide repeats
VGKWERVESLPDIITLNRLAEILGVDLNYFSEKFKSVATENSAVGPQFKTLAESAPESGKKLSWDMSRGNWVGADFTGVKIKSGGFEKNTISGTSWNQSSFIDTYVADVVFEGQVDDCYFENCAFKRVTFKNAKLKNTFFKNKSLKGIYFTDCQADRMTYEFLKNGKADLKGIELITT